MTDQNQIDRTGTVHTLEELLLDLSAFDSPDDIPPAVEPRLTHALALAAQGFHVFPLGDGPRQPGRTFEGDAAERSKRPRIGWNDYQSRPATEAEIRAWWTDWPEANIGLATGNAVVVVDADNQAAIDWIEAGHLPATPWRVSTGRGLHFYFAVNPDLEVRNSANAAAAIDVRGIGGYVVAPGSIHFTGRVYAWQLHAGSEPLPMLTAEHLQAIADHDQRCRAEAGRQPALPGVKPKTDGSPAVEGARNSTAAALAGKQIRAGKTLAETQAELRAWNRTNPVPLPDDEIDTVVCSVANTHERRTGQSVPVAPPLPPAQRQAVPASAPTFRSRSMLDITPEPTDWIWRDRFATKLNVIAGNPGMGKSQITISMAATVSTGGRWPDMTPCEKGSVLFISAEDDAADTIVPRLMAVGADRSRIHIIDGVDTADGRMRMWSLQHDVEGLEDMVRQIGDVRLIIIDPVTAYLGSVDGHSTSDVRGLLTPLADLAQRHRVAVVLVSHLNKSTKSEAMTRITGSGAYVAAARAVYLVGAHPEDENLRCIAPLKNNLGDDHSGFAYQVVSAEVADGIETSRIKWEGSAFEVSAEAVLAGPRKQADEDQGANSAKGEAIAFLIKMLTPARWVPSKHVIEEANAAGISKNTFWRARDALEIQTRQVKGSGHQMRLPEAKTEADPEPQIPDPEPQTQNPS